MSLLARRCSAPDVAVSVTTTELKRLVEGIRFIEKMKANPIDKDAAAAETDPMRQLFTKSVVTSMDLSAGTVLKKDHLTIKKPGTGILAEQIDQVVGRRLQRDVKADQLLDKDDLEPPPDRG